MGVVSKSLSPLTTAGRGLTTEPANRDTVLIGSFSGRETACVRRGRHSVYRAWERDQWGGGVGGGGWGGGGGGGGGGGAGGGVVEKHGEQ